MLRDGVLTHEELLDDPCAHECYHSVGTKSEDEMGQRKGSISRNHSIGVHRLRIYSRSHVKEVERNNIATMLNF